VRPRPPSALSQQPREGPWDSPCSRLSCPLAAGEGDFRMSSAPIGSYGPGGSGGLRVPIGVRSSARSTRPVARDEADRLEPPIPPRTRKSRRPPGAAEASKHPAKQQILCGHDASFFGKRAGTRLPCAGRRGGRVVECGGLENKNRSCLSSSDGTCAIAVAEPDLARSAGPTVSDVRMVRLRALAGSGWLSGDLSGWFDRIHDRARLASDRRSELTMSPDDRHSCLEARTEAS
jgi:hypothetical protein